MAHPRFADGTTRLERLAQAIGRYGLVRAVALAARPRLFPPGSPREGFYLRRLRPLARFLPSGHGRRPRLGPLTRWSGPPARLLGNAPVRSILVIKLDHIGDFLLAAPSFGLLRRSFPHARITLLCGPWNAAIGERSGFFDAVTPFAFFGAQAEADRPAAALAPLDALGPFDLAIDLRVDPDTRPVLARVTARCKAAYWDPDLGPDLAIALAPPRIDPDARDTLRGHQRQLLLNLVAAAIGYCDPAGDTAATVRRLSDPAPSDWARPVIALQIGSGRAIKNWPLDRFIALAGRLRDETDGTLVLLGSADQRVDADRLVAALGSARIIDQVGALSLPQSLGVLAEADLFIGNDSGLGHAHAALGRPTLILFSGIDPLPSWAPLGPRAVALKREVSCSPCHLSRLGLCPHAHLCMTGIETDAVLDEALGLLRPG